MADNIQLLQPTSKGIFCCFAHLFLMIDVSEPQAASEPHPTSSKMVLPGTPITSLQEEGTLSGHVTNGAHPNLINGPSSLSRLPLVSPRPCMSTHGQAQQEKNSKFLNENTPLLPGSRRWTTGMYIVNVYTLI